MRIRDGDRWAVAGPAAASPHAHAVVHLDAVAHNTSQYPRMWQAAGLGHRDLLDVLVDTARARRPPPVRSGPRPGA